MIFDSAYTLAIIVEQVRITTDNKYDLIMSSKQPAGQRLDMKISDGCTEKRSSKLAEYRTTYSERLLTQTRTVKHL